MTNLIISAEDFVIECPHCNIPQDSIVINRVFNPTIECDTCYSEFELVITTEA